MTAPRFNPQQEELRKDILGNHDNSSIKMKFVSLGQEMDRVGKKHGYDNPLVDSIKDQFDFAYKVGDQSFPDGSIVKLIKDDIEDCIANGVITTQAQGAERLEEYRILLISVLTQKDLDIATAPKKLNEVISAKRDEMKKEEKNMMGLSKHLLHQVRNESQTKNKPLSSAKTAEAAEEQQEIAKERKGIAEKQKEIAKEAVQQQAKDNYVKALESMKKKNLGSIRARFSTSLRAQEQKMRDVGISESEIKTLKKSSQSPSRITATTSSSPRITATKYSFFSRNRQPSTPEKKNESTQSKTSSFKPGGR